MVLYPHDHNLWAVIVHYGGQEDNTFFTRNHQGKGLLRASSQVLQTQEAIALEKDAIHAVNNPRSAYTGAIHEYGGDFFDEPRSQWAFESSEEAPYSVEQATQAFADADERWLAQHN